MPANDFREKLTQTHRQPINYNYAWKGNFKNESLLKLANWKWVLGL